MTHYQTLTVASDVLLGQIKRLKDKGIVVAELEWLKETIDKSLLEPETFSEREALTNALERIGWDEINAFKQELHKGQSIHEDAGGFFKRSIKRLFGVLPYDEIMTYKKAAKSLIDKAKGKE